MNSGQRVPGDIGPCRTLRLAALMRGSRRRLVIDNSRSVALITAVLWARVCGALCERLCVFACVCVRTLVSARVCIGIVVAHPPDIDHFDNGYFFAWLIGTSFVREIAVRSPVLRIPSAAFMGSLFSWEIFYLLLARNFSEETEPISSLGLGSLCFLCCPR